MEITTIDNRLRAVLKHLAVASVVVAGIGTASVRAQVTRTYSNGKEDAAAYSTSAPNDPTTLTIASGSAKQSGILSGSGTVIKSGSGRTAGNWVFSYQRSAASRPPATPQIVEYGDSLSGWTQVPIPLNETSNVTITPQGESDRVAVTLPATGTKGFARLKVSQQGE